MVFPERRIFTYYKPCNTRHKTVDLILTEKPYNKG